MKNKKKKNKSSFSKLTWWRNIGNPIQKIHFFFTFTTFLYYLHLFLNPTLNSNLSSQPSHSPHKPNQGVGDQHNLNSLFSYASSLPPSLSLSLSQIFATVIWSIWWGFLFYFQVWSMNFKISILLYVFFVKFWTLSINRKLILLIRERIQSN